MIYNNVFRDVGTLSPYTPLRQIAPLVLAGIVSAAGSAIAGGANALSTNAANKRTIANQNELWEKQKAYQNWLNANGALIQKQSMQRAGFNPNAEFGTSANLQAPTPQKSDIQPTDYSLLSSVGSDVAQMIQQQPVVDATVQKTNADAQLTKANADYQNIVNDRLRSEDATYHNEYNAINPPQDGSIPETIVTPANKGTFDALRAINQYKGELSDIDARTAQNALAKNVAQMQLNNPKVVDALVRMPFREFRKLFYETLDIMEDINLKKAQTSYYDSQTALNQLEEEITRNSNIHEMITKYLGDGATADFAHVMVLLLGSLTGNMRFGANVSKFSGKTKSTNTNTTNSSVRTSSTSVNHNYNHSK